MSRELHRDLCAQLNGIRTDSCDLHGRRREKRVASGRLHNYQDERDTILMAVAKAPAAFQAGADAAAVVTDANAILVTELVSGLH